MRSTLFRTLLVLGAFVALPALAQNPTGTLSGRVLADDQPLPGVTVTATSETLQGARVTQTTANGDYIFPFMPAGEYTVKFEISGFQTAEQTIKLSAAQSSQLDMAMSLEGVSEEVMVTGAYETISQTPQASTTYEKVFLEELPVNRDIAGAVTLAPGVSTGGPADGIVISGAQSYESLFLVNGVVVNENLRGQPNDLFIEDAIQETTTTTSGISAEYGRFAGGVVNVLTKSGGNQFEGSLRTNFTNEDWGAETPLTVSQADTINETYEATLGGYLWRDRLWFFLAGRDLDTSAVAQTVLTNLPYANDDSETRLEGKVTFSLAEGHSLVGSYMDVEEKDGGVIFGSVLDLASVYARELPQTLASAHYSGVLTRNFFVEAQYSEREFTFVDSGSQFTDRIRGTLLVDNPQGTGNRFNSPTFCGACDPDEERNNENYLVKGSWFLSGDKLGSHDLVFGYDHFNDIRAADNHQSGSDFRLLLSGRIIQGGEVFPVILPGRAGNFTTIQWNPILITTSGTDFVTNSYFVNDGWRLNNNWSFNIGARYDVNDGKNAQGVKVIDDAKLSPRVGLTFDPKGDGDWLINASYAEYVTAVANNQADASSAAGAPATLQWFYEGPAINATGPLVPTEEAVRRVFEWFDTIGGTDSDPTRAISIPGGTTLIRDSLASPSTLEYTVGAAKRLGSRGLARVDYVRRESEDFYADRRDLSTGRVRTPTGAFADLSIIENDSSLLERTYDGVHVAATYRLYDRLNLGGNYTWSHTQGNFDGETRASGPVRSAILNYPEYRDVSWNAPKGDLSSDQRHRLRLWGRYDIINNQRHRLNAALLQSYFSGRPYSAAGNVDTRRSATNPNGIVNPGYVQPPTSVAYFFSERGAFKTSDVLATDVALSYSFKWGAFGRDLEIFVQPEVLNVFNEQEIASTDVNFFNTLIFTAVNTTATSCGGARCQPFNPFTETPVEGVHWAKGPQFGQAISPDAFQKPRTFRVSVGIRF